MIQNMLDSIKTFTYAMTIDLNMGYYAMELDEASKELCIIILPWGKFRYKDLPTGVCVESNVFQQALGCVFQDLPHVLVYINDIIVIRSETFSEHMEQVNEALQQLVDMGLQINAIKLTWVQVEVNYLGFVLTCEGVKPQQERI